VSADGPPHRRGGARLVRAAGLAALAVVAALLAAQAETGAAAADCPAAGTRADAQSLGCRPPFLTRSKARGVQPGPAGGVHERTYVVDKNNRAANEYQFLDQAIAATKAGGVVTIASRDRDIIRSGESAPVVMRPMTIVVDPRDDAHRRTDRYGVRQDGHVYRPIRATAAGRCLTVDLTQAAPADEKLEVILKGLRFTPREPGSALGECVTVKNGDVIFEDLSIDGGDSMANGARVESIGVAVDGGVVTFKGGFDAARGRRGLDLRNLDVGVFAYGGIVEFETDGTIQAGVGIASSGGDVRIQPAAGAAPISDKPLVEMLEDEQAAGGGAGEDVTIVRKAGAAPARQLGPLLEIEASEIGVDVHQGGVVLARGRVLVRPPSGADAALHCTDIFECRCRRTAVGTGLGEDGAPEAFNQVLRSATLADADGAPRNHNLAPAGLRVGPGGFAYGGGWNIRAFPLGVCAEGPDAGGAAAGELRLGRQSGVIGSEIGVRIENGADAKITQTSILDSRLAGVVGDSINMEVSRNYVQGTGAAAGVDGSGCAICIGPNTVAYDEVRLRRRFFLGTAVRPQVTQAPFIEGNVLRGNLGPAIRFPTDWKTEDLDDFFTLQNLTSNTIFCNARGGSNRTKRIFKRKQTYFARNSMSDYAGRRCGPFRGAPLMDDPSFAPAPLQVSMRRMREDLQRLANKAAAVSPKTAPRQARALAAEGDAKIRRAACGRRCEGACAGGVCEVVYTGPDGRAQTFRYAADGAASALPPDVLKVCGSTGLRRASAAAGDADCLQRLVGPGD